MKLLDTLPACSVIAELQFRGKIGASRTRSILVDYRARSIPVSQSAQAQNKTIFSADL